MNISSSLKSFFIKSSVKSVNKKPLYSKKEEFLNSITHGFGIIFAIFSLVYLSLKFHKYDNFSVISFLIYSITLITLYTGSTLYHLSSNPKLKKYFRKLDHCSIFLLISGTYTPICINYIKSFESIFLLICLWIISIIGIVLNCIDVNKFSRISLGCYILMGWSVVFMTKPLFLSLSKSQLMDLLIGGLFYTIGAVIYVLGKKIKNMHSIWHLFVLGGSLFHFMIFTKN